MSKYTDDAQKHMDKAIEALGRNFSKVRTGRANPHVLDSIKVDYYGVPTPITQLAGIKTPEASMLIVEPWDKKTPPQHREGHRAVRPGHHPQQ